jgi:iron complex outermembrane receptor protein
MPVLAEEDAASQPGEDDVQAVIVTANRATRSSVSLAAVEAQKVLPGISPLKAIENLPRITTRVPGISRVTSGAIRST